MKCIFTSVSLLLFCFHSFVFGQQPGRCSTSEYMLLQEEKYPGTIQRWIDARKAAKQSADDHTASTREDYVIPVVVHVVYKTANQNISDEQIQTQIDVLNEDFNRRNADTANTPSVFKPVAASMSVKFGLAAYDPEGNPTSGIVRMATTHTSFDLDDSVKHTSKGGSDAWPSEDYLNIWVCNLSSDILGYTSYNPGGPSDGVVVTYSAFGRGSFFLKPQYDKGRTTTHEVGHWLALDHTFSGGCSDGDDCSDTPPEDEPVYQCPAFPHISCNNGPNGDMFMNYMDYTDDDCMNLFTECQVNIMDEIITGARESILTSPAGIHGVAYDLDAAISTIVDPTDTVFQQGFEPQVQLSNRGAQEITYVKIFFRVDGQEPGQFEYFGNLPSQVSTPVTLPVYFTSEGGHNFCAWTAEPNHGTDQFIFNDTACDEFQVRSTVAKNTTSADPNPATDEITINVKNPSAAIMEVRLVNILGQVVQDGNWSVISEPVFTMDVSNLPNGLYFLHAKIGYDYVKKKIMVTRK